MKRNQILQIVVAFIVGIMFAVGLAVSGMTQPQKVLGFLRLGPGWDPSLMFVMLGAIPIHALAYRLFIRRSSPLLDVQWHVPTGKEITKPLIVGSLLFGLGWGLGGYCPGPGLTSMGAGSGSATVFVGFMLIGMFLYRKVPWKF